MFKCEFFLLCIFVSTLCSLEKCVCLDTLIYSKKNCRAYFSHLDLFFKLSYFRRDFERTIVDVVIAILIVFLIFLYFWPRVNLNILIMENHFHRPNGLNPFVFHPLQIIDLISKYFLFILFLSCITSSVFHSISNPSSSEIKSTSNFQVLIFRVTSAPPLDVKKMDLTNSFDLIT